MHRWLNIGYNEVQLVLLDNLLSYSLHTLTQTKRWNSSWVYGWMIHSFNKFFLALCPSCHEGKKKMNKIQFQHSKRRLRTIYVRQNKCFYIDENNCVIEISCHYSTWLVFKKIIQMKLASITSLLPFLYLCSLNSLVLTTLRRVFLFYFCLVSNRKISSEHREIGKTGGFPSTFESMGRQCMVDETHFTLLVITIASISRNTG